MPEIDPAAVPEIDPAGVAGRLAEVRRRIAAAGDATRVRVIAVTKGFGPDAVHAAVAAGLPDIGENYAQELRAKAAEVGTAVRWHFLGPVQRNKVAGLAPVVSTWHGVDRPAAGEAVARHRPGATVLVQVNASGEATKHGCAPDELARLLAALHGMELDVAGLMTIAPAGDRGAARAAFGRVADLAGEHGLRELSMGMTDDLEDAVEAGSTMVRVGRALFGPRSVGADLRR